MIKRIATFLILVSLCFSCQSPKKLVYMNEGVSDNMKSETTNYAYVLQPDDNVIITVTADEPYLAAPFNLLYLNMQSNEVTTSVNNNALLSYLIDQNGEIDFAGLGKIKIAGLSRIEAENKIKDMLKQQIANPGVNLRIINFKVSVLGEVARPGQVAVPGERITIFEALGGAGDLTIYGKRKEVMLIREENGMKTVNFIDLTDAKIIDSPYYYLHRNDVLYVKPNNTKVNSSVIGPNIVVGISALSLVVTIIALSTK